MPCGVGGRRHICLVPSGSAKGKSSSSLPGTCTSTAREATHPRTEKKLGMLLEGKERDLRSRLRSQGPAL